MAHCGYCLAEMDAGADHCASCGKPPLKPPPPKKSNERMLVGLVGCGLAVGVFLFCGVIAGAVAIPNLTNAVDRGKAKRTMADIRSLATAIEIYSVEHERYPDASSVDELVRQLAPDYTVDPVTVDAWGFPLVVESQADLYLICSGGKDGGHCELLGQGGPAPSLDDSIIFRNGEFIQWPEGT